LYQYRVIEIVNQEPLKIGAGGNKANQTEPSKDYIPGSAIRGAIIGELVRKDLFEAKKRAILTQIEFYNAYPCCNERLYMPAPQHLHIDKHEWRKKKSGMQALNEAEIQLVKLTNLLLEKDNLEKAKNALTYRFVAIKEGNCLAGIKVAKEYRLHHNTSRNPDKEKRENLFRYQAIAAGQRFRSIIRFDESLGEYLQAVLQQTATLYLGGAKGSGYGLCQMRAIGGVLPDYREVKCLAGLYDAPDLQPTDKLIITCLSDCLCRNAYGQPVNYIPEDYIKEICGETVELCDQFIETGITEGYNTTWKARYPKETTLKAGSVLVYRLEKKQSEDNLKKIICALESRLIGHRTQDGFGWIGVNVPYPDKLAVKADEPCPEQEEKGADETELWREIQQDEQSKQVMSILLSGLQAAKERWLNMLCIKSWAGAESGEAWQEPGENSFTISPELTRRQYRQMMDLLDEKLKDSRKKSCLSAGALNYAVLERDYINDKRLCSIVGFNFSQIMKYLNPDGLDSEYAALAKYAENKLKSRKGRLFYPEDLTAGYPKKQFIAELLHAGLYIRHRRKGQ